MSTLYCYDLLTVVDFANILNNIQTVDNKLNIKEYSTKSQNSYKIIKYNKDLFDEESIKTTGLIRSVVINQNNHVVSVSPSKSFKMHNFFNKYPEKISHIIGEEFVEGTMINLFWDNSIGVSGAWEIATRNTVGGNVSFYKSKNSKTFNEMFLEACFYNNLNINLLDTNYCYSFVLQHPENRIVVPFEYPQLYLIEVYKIENTSKNIIVDVQCLSKMNIFGFNNSTVKIPEIYDSHTYQELIDKYASNNSSYGIVGVVFKNLLTGERTKKRNPVYEQIKQLKHNQPKTQYRYLCLRKEGKVREYLQYFPEDKIECNKVRQQLHDFTNTLYSNYIECYIKKQKKLIEFPLQYRNHMLTLHNIYRNELLEKKLYITTRIVIDYINNLHPSQQMYFLNYNMRKRIVDFLHLSTFQTPII